MVRHGRTRGIVLKLNLWQEIDGDDETLVIWPPLYNRSDASFDTTKGSDINEFKMVEFRLNLVSGAIQCKVIDTSMNIEFSVMD